MRETPHGQKISAKNTGRKPCGHEGCTRSPSLNRSLCSKHNPQFKKYGFTWDSYPHEKMAEWREAHREECAVDSCQLLRTSDKSPLCYNHRSDWSRKDCSLGFYLDLMSHDSCEVCGATDRRMVTDHDHRHPHGRDRMCPTCIRGRVCTQCNSALGHVGDDPRRLYALADYLAKFEARNPSGESV